MGSLFSTCYLSTENLRIMKILQGEVLIVLFLSMALHLGEVDSVVCNSNELKCNLERGKMGCIPKSWICDGEEDCEDAKDEEDCDSDCNSDQFLCPADNTCISGELRCDGKADCEEGEDEEECDEGDDY